MGYDECVVVAAAPEWRTTASRAAFFGLGALLLSGCGAVGDAPPGALADPPSAAHVLLRAGGPGYRYPSFSMQGGRLFSAAVEGETYRVRVGPPEGPWTATFDVEASSGVTPFTAPRIQTTAEEVILWNPSFGPRGQRWHRFAHDLTFVDDGLVPHYVECASALQSGRAALVESWNETVTFRVPEPWGNVWKPIGWCSAANNPHHVAWNGAAFDVLLACKPAEAKYLEVDADGEVLAGPTFVGSYVELEPVSGSGFGCSGPAMVRDAARVLVAFPFAGATRFVAVTAEAGEARVEPITDVAASTLPVGSYQMATWAGRLLVLANTCGYDTMPDRTLCSFRLDDFSLAGCQEIHNDIENTEAHLIADAEGPVLAFLQGTNALKNALFTARIEDPDLGEPVLARSVEAAPGDERAMMVDCDEGGASCRVVSVELDPELPRPREQREAHRPVHYRVAFEGPSLERAPADSLVWSRTVSAAPRLVAGNVLVADWGDRQLTFIDENGAIVGETTNDQLDNVLPLNDGFLAWSTALQVCRYSSNGERVACEAGEELVVPISSDGRRSELARCGDRVIAFQQEESSSGAGGTDVTLVARPVDIDALTAGDPILRTTAFRDSALDLLFPRILCSARQFVVIEQQPGDSAASQARLRRFGLDGRARGNAEHIPWSERTELRWQADGAGNVIIEQRREDVYAARRARLFVVPPTGSVVPRVTTLPERGSRQAVWPGLGSQIVAWSAEESGDLWLSRLPLEDPEAAGPDPDDGPPEEPPPGFEPPPSRCESGVLVDDTVSHEELDTLAGCEMLVGNLSITGSALADLSVLGSLRTVTGRLEISKNASLATLGGLETLERAGGLRIAENPVLRSGALPSLVSVGPGGLSVQSNALLESLSLPALRELAGSLDVRGNPSLVTFPAPPSVQGIEALNIAYNTALPQCTVAEWISAAGSPQGEQCDNLADACGSTPCPPPP